jgi:hypothetical protein
MSNFLKRNEHIAERVVRVGLGLLLVSLAAVGTIGLWGYIGVLPIVTGLAGSCPFYTLAGISTCPVRRTRA